MTLCENCKQQVTPAGKLVTRTRHANSELFEAGKIYWETMTAAMNAAENALERNGFALPESWAYTLTDSTASVRADVGGKWLTVNLYRMGSGRYELVAYVN